MNKITDKVYLGDCFGADDETAIKAHKITHVLSCMGHLSPKYKDKSIVQKIIELEDDEKQNIFQYFRDSIKFIENSDRVFVHCFAVVSRSAALVIAYFMWKNKMSFKESLNFVSKYRNIGPNMGFRNQLLILEKKLKEANYDLDKINWNIVWPPKEGIKYDYTELF